MPPRNRSSRRRTASNAPAGSGSLVEEGPSQGQQEGSLQQPAGATDPLAPRSDKRASGAAPEVLVCAACPSEHEDAIIRICRARKIMRAFEPSQQRSTRAPWTISEWIVAVQVAVVGMVEQHDASRARILCIEGGAAGEEQMGNQHRLLQAIRSALGQATFPIRMEWLPFEDFGHEFDSGFQAHTPKLSKIAPPDASSSHSATTASTTTSTTCTPSSAAATTSTPPPFCKGAPPNRVPGMGGKGGALVGSSAGAGGAPDGGTTVGGGKGKSPAEPQTSEKGRGRHRSSSRRGRSRNGSKTAEGARGGADTAWSQGHSGSQPTSTPHQGFVIVDERSGNNNNNNSNNFNNNNSNPSNNNNNQDSSASKTNSSCGNNNSSSNSAMTPRNSNGKNCFMAPARSSPPTLPPAERGPPKAVTPGAAVRSPTPGLSPWADPYSEAVKEPKLQYQGSSSWANPPKLPKEKMEGGPKAGDAPVVLAASPVQTADQEGPEAWPDLMTAAQTPMPGASRLRNRSATRTQQPSQPRSASVRGLSQSRMRGMQSRRDPVMVMWNCRECGQQFQGQDLLLDHQESEGHWGPTLEASCSKTLVRKWDSRSKPSPTTPGADSGQEFASGADVGGAECFSLISPRGSDAEGEEDLRTTAAV